MARSLEIHRLETAGPTELGRYQILEEIGRGGMGEVALALRDGASELCVLKRLTGSMIGNPVAAKRFYREAHIAALLDHEGIARTIDAGFADDSFYIAMEYIAGVDVETIRREIAERRQQLPIAFVVTVGLRVLDVLAYAHDAKGPDDVPLSIVHRDLAPKNLMVTFDGRVKVIDFGVARASVGDFETKSDILVGTVQYFSPEQARGRRVDRRSDLYTLSTVLFEMLTGRVLVPGGAMVDMLRLICEAPVPSIRGQRSEVSRSLADVIVRGLEKDPEKRWTTAAAYANALASAGITPLDPTSLGAEIRSSFPDLERKMSQRLDRAGRFIPHETLAEDQWATTATGVAGELTRATEVIVVDGSEPTESTRVPTVLAPPRVIGPRSSRLPTVALSLAAAAITLAVAASYRPPKLISPEPPPPKLAVTPRPIPEPQPILENLPPISTQKVARKAHPPPLIPPGNELERALSKRNLTMAALHHQHHIDGVRRLEIAVATGDRAAIEQASRGLLGRLEEIDLHSGKLRQRIAEIKAQLHARKDSSFDQEILDLQEEIVDDLSPAPYGDLCARIDALERRVK